MRSIPKRYLPWSSLVVLTAILIVLIPVGQVLWSQVLYLHGEVNTGDVGPQPPPPVCVYGSPTIKSIWPALVELDPQTLRIKDGSSFWMITKGNADPRGNYAWGLSATGSAAAPSIDYLHTICNFNNGNCVGSAYPWASTFHIDLPSGLSTRLAGTGVSAFGLAEGGGSVYVAYGSLIARLSGGVLALPERIGGLDYVSAPQPYLLAITRELGSHKVWRVTLDGAGNPSGFSLALIIDHPPGSPLEPYRYTSVAYAVIPWGTNPSLQVLYVSKDDGSLEPADVAAIVDFQTGQLLHFMPAVESGVLLDTAITWPNGIKSPYVSWANPQGLASIDGRLFLVSRYYWNKGPLCAPRIKVVKDGPQEASLGQAISYHFTVSNIGEVPLSNVSVVDNVLGDISAHFRGGNAGSSSLAIGKAVQFTVAYTIPGDAPNPLLNTVIARGSFQNVNVEDDDSHSLTLIPQVTLRKTGPSSAEPQSVVEYRIEVTNSGDLELEDGLVSDPTIAIQAPLGLPLFADNFNSAAPHGDWMAVGSPAPWSIVPLGGGNWAWRRTTLDPVGFPEGQMVNAAGAGSWMNYSLSLDLRVEVGNRFPGGVRVRANPATGAGYSVWVYPVDGLIRLWRSPNWQINAGERALLSEAATVIPAGWNHLRVDAVGSLITVYWNGVEVLSFSDGTYSTGTIALEPARSENISGVAIDYDNVRLVPLPARLASGETAVYTFNHNLPGNAPSPYPNTASVSARAGGIAVGASDDHQIVIEVNPQIDLEKYVSVDGRQTWADADAPIGPAAYRGEEVFFRYQVTNTGTVTLSNLVLADDSFDLSSCLLVDPLPPASSFECIIGPFAAQLGQHVNQALASGDYAGSTYKDFDKAHYYGRLPAGSDPPIVASADDTYLDRLNNNWVNHLTDDYIVVRDGFWAGLRFVNLDIPKDAVITQALLEVQIYKSYNDPTLYVYAEDVDNATDFSGSLVPNRPRTDAAVRWTESDVGVGWVAFPDLSAVIQEIVDRPGWQPGNAIALLIRGIPNGRIVFAQWDLEGEVSAAHLTLAFDTAVVENQAPRVELPDRLTATLPTGGDPVAVSLPGSVVDDGLPDPPAAIESRWERVDGPGEVVFEDASAVASKAYFVLPGVYRLRLVAGDGEASADAQIEVTILAPNLAPQAAPDSYGMPAGETLLVAAADGVLKNDHDPEGGAISAQLVSAPAYGTLELAADGGFRYSPEQEFSGEDVFEYRASDGKLSSASVRVTITVGVANHPPQSADDEAQTSPDTQVRIEVLTNDDDPDGDDLAINSFTQSEHGSVTQSEASSLVYTPGAGFVGADQFSYQVVDTHGAAAEAQVHVEVLGPLVCEPAIEVEHLSSLRSELVVDLAGTEFLTARLGLRGGAQITPVSLADFSYAGQKTAYRQPYQFMDRGLVDEGGMLLNTELSSRWSASWSTGGACATVRLYTTLLNSDSSSRQVRYRLQVGEQELEFSGALCGNCRESYAILVSGSGEVAFSMVPLASMPNTYYLAGAAAVSP